ncbi:NADH-quinone oxidoreductase subunit L [Olivibacter sp. XZL3]|uniref:NADH-quinone oxidoreductase subunit L n=1 Tax=Olivibacter sp. XZL3 TaxID=1735116 RepID=UPI00106471B9|nr:NADH-quinone oxidoreductase subunit L [Olivibacter sp. XZL3]
MDQLSQISTPVLAALIVLCAPLISFGLSAIAGKRLRSGIPATVAIAISLLAAIFIFATVWNGQQVHQQTSWFRIGEHSFKAGILLNNLSALLLLLVCAIALPVHVYSMVYMKGDYGIHRYWLYLSLFCFAMLGLVMADSLLLMYIGWELVGFASYLLIGFWFTRPAAIKANKKAFLINRIGDLGFLIGIAIIYTQFQTLDLVALFGDHGMVREAFNDGVEWRYAQHAMPAFWLTIAGAAFFLGAMAKSAQFPFHIWLPDAMEGPTSVSSLIHAATMVAAGVFMLVRISPLFDAQILLLIGAIGAFTALMAATIALTQQDIKKILAFSTISQLGFMMVAIGIGQYGVAIFHLVTHAFFKCLLFLSAGAVIHEMQHVKETLKLELDPQDIRNMGGLRRYMPHTFRLTLVAALALAGLPLTAGYLSKDAILIFAFEWAEWQSAWWKFIPVSLLVTSALTAFYIARLVFKVFYGKPRISAIGQGTNYLHEAPRGMLLPMLFLGLCSLFPLFSYNPLLFEDTWIIKGFELPETLERVNIYHTVVPAAVNGLAIVMIFIAWRWYAQGKYPQGSLRGRLYEFSAAQWYLNVMYEKGIVKPLLKVSKMLYAFDRTIVDGLVDTGAGTVRWFANTAQWLDRALVDGLVNGVGKAAVFAGGVLRGSRKGKIQYYLFSMFLVLLIVLFVGLKIFSP